ncbi:hypothetical protein, conserved [Plasmodium malariae]|uniref:Uncharacterized protein n=1 Tax=Plasmodium malariae TaxID=5858 RepID=A0A1A8WR18_PLAMA|nr:hypothetical protein, conserved [Plasmodium malariae]
MFYLYNKLTESSRKSHNEKSNSNVRKEKDVIFSSDGNMYRKKHREEDYKKDEDFFLMFEEKERNEGSKLNKGDSESSSEKQNCNIFLKDENIEGAHIISELKEKKKDTEREMDVKWKGNDMKCERIDVACEGAGVAFEWIETMCEGVGESSEQPDIHTDNVNAQCEQLDESGDDFFKIDEGNFSTFTFAASYDTKRNSVEGYSGNTNYECKRSDVINEENYENPSSILNVNISFADNGRNLLLSDEKKELQNDNSESLVLEKTLSVPTLYKNEAFFIPHKNLTQSDDNVSEYKKEKLEFLLLEDGNKNIKKDEHSERGYTLKEVTSIYSYNHNSVHVKSEKEVSINEKIKTEFLCSNISEKNISHESLCKKMNSNSAVTYGNLDGENERKADTFNINFIFAKTDSEGGKMGNSNDNEENKRGNLKEAYSHNNAHIDMDYEANDDKYNSDVHSSVHNDIPNSAHNDIQNGVPNTNVHISRNNLKDDSSEFFYFFHSNKGDGNLGEQIFVNKNLENLEKIIEQDNNRSLLGNILGGKKEIESSHVELENGNDNEVLEKSGSVNSETMEVGSIKSGKDDEQFIWESPSEVKGIVNGKEKIYSENKDVVEVEEAAVEVVDLKDEKRFESKEVAEEEEVVEAAVDYEKEKLFESKEMVEKEKVVDKEVEYIEKKRFESKEVAEEEEVVEAAVDYEKEKLFENYEKEKLFESKEMVEKEKVVDKKVEYIEKKRFESKEVVEEEVVNFVEEKRSNNKYVIEAEEVAEGIVDYGEERAAVDYEKEKLFESKEMVEKEKVVDKKVEYIEKKQFESKEMTSKEEAEYVERKILQSKEFTEEEEVVEFDKEQLFESKEAPEKEKVEFVEKKLFESKEMAKEEAVTYEKEKKFESKETTEEEAYIEEKPFQSKEIVEEEVVEYEEEKLFENKEMTKVEEMGEITAKINDFGSVEMYETEKILEERRNFASFEDNSLERIELKNSKFNELNENNNKLENINERNMTKVKMCESVILEKREENEKKCENKKLTLEEINEIKVDKIFNIKSIEEEKKKEAIFSLNKEHAHSLIDEGYEEGFLLSFELNNSKRTFGDDNININNTIKEQLEDANTEMSCNHFLNIINEENIHRIYDVTKELNCSQKNSLKEEREFSINGYKKNVLYEQNGNIINHINNSYLNNKLQSGRNNGRSEFTKDIEELEIAMRKCNEKEVDRNDKVEKRITLLDMEHTANLRKVEHEEIIFKCEKKKKGEKRNKRNKKHINRYLFNITKQFEYESNSLQYLKALKELPPLKFLKCKDMKPFLHLFNIVLKVVCEHYQDFVYVLAGDETGCIYVKLSLKHKEFCEAGKNFILANCCSAVEGYRIILEINEYSNIFLLKYNTIKDVNKNINFSDAKFVTLSECRI